MNIKLSEKYQPLFELPLARTTINAPNFQDIYSKSEQEYWRKLAGVNTVIVTGGRYSVKSFGVSTASCIWAHDYHHRILFTRYTMKSAGDSIIPEFVEKINMLGIHSDFHIIKERIESKRKRPAPMPNAKIVFKGIKTSEGNMTANLKSLKDFSCFILDEAEEMPSFEDWEKIMLSIRATDVQNFNVIVMNPAMREHWVYKEFYEGPNVPEGFNGIVGSVLYIHTTYEDCPREFIPDPIYDKIMKGKAAHVAYSKTEKEFRDKLPAQVIKLHKWYKNVILGGWLDAAEGVIYEDWEVGDFNDSLPYVWGLDFGSNDPDALVRVAVDRNKMRIYVKQGYFKNNTGTAQLMEILHKTVGTNDLIIADAAERRMIKDFQFGTYATDGVWLGGVNIKRCRKRPVAIGIKTISGYTIVVESGSTDIQKALRNYCWHDKRAGVPNHDWSDLMDALRYAALYLIF